MTNITAARMNTHSSSIGPCILEGSRVRLEPLELRHAQSLVSAGEGFDWAWLSARLSDISSVENWIKEALEKERTGEEFPFVVISKPEGKIVGSTRYMDTRPHDKGTEIGWTWYSPKVWGTAVNPECKYLLLKHAFEDWEAIRVQLKTDNNNLHSQRAILKLGAKFEGRLRNHRFRRDGTIRDTMMYSITNSEWPEVKASLLERLRALGLEEISYQ